jgi:hypothetical protein
LFYGKHHSTFFFACHKFCLFGHSGCLNGQGANKKQDAEGISASWGLWFFGINGDDVGGVDGFIGFLVQHKQPQGYGADLVNAFQAEAAQIPQFDVA